MTRKRASRLSSGKEIEMTFSPEELQALNRNTKIRELAAKAWLPADDIHIDDGAPISEGDDNGTWVQAWVWVSFFGTELDKNKEDEQ